MDSATSPGGCAQDDDWRACGFERRWRDMFSDSWKPEAMDSATAPIGCAQNDRWRVCGFDRLPLAAARRVTVGGCVVSTDCGVRPALFAYRSALGAPLS